MGRACPLCPNASNLDLLSNGERIIDFDAEIPDGTFHFRVAKQKLDGTQVAGATVDQRCLRAAERVSAEDVWIACERVSVRGNVFDLDRNDIAPSQLAIDCEIEHRQIAGSLLDLQLGPNGPDVPCEQRRFRPDQLSFVPGRALRRE
jgi:hypothetical protein